MLQNSNLFADAKTGFCLLRSQELDGRVHIGLAYKLPHRGTEMVLDFPSTNLSIFAAGNVLGGERARSRPCDVVFDAHHILPSDDLGEAHFPPVLPPRVSDDPVVLAGIRILAEARDGDNVIGLCAGGLVVEDAALVIAQGGGIDRGGDRAPGVNLGLDLVHLRGLILENITDAAHFPVFRDGGVGEVVELYALAALVGESGASAAGVDSTAGRIDLGAESLLGFLRAC
mmetsp:Transcript_26442/g.63451  ORF Transcript_26442/g.63451 Transcript_26442/m.63451 type:complete len:229 (+) Transcript_26442:388-1074(+)